MNQIPHTQHQPLQTSHLPILSSNPTFISYLQHLQQLIPFLNCPICRIQAKQPHMCPYCCQMVCQNCLGKWFMSQKQECPTCNKHLKYQLTINCQSLSKQIQQIIANISQDLTNTSISSSIFNPIKSIQYNSSQYNIYYKQLYNNVKNNQICVEHQLIYQYYCYKCIKRICSDCAVISKQHSGHKIGKLKQKKIQFQDYVSQLLHKLTNYKKQIQQLKNSQSSQLQKSSQYENQKIQIYKSYIKILTDSILTKISTRYDNKQKIYKLFQQQIRLLNTQFNKISNIIDQQDKCTLIKESICLESQIQKILDKQFKNMYGAKIGGVSEVVPSFVSKTVIINNFDLIAQNPTPISSDPLYWNDSQWQLKIFFTPKHPPATKHPSPSPPQTYLSIYLQMSKGHHYPNLYKYQIILINQLDFTKSIGCRFENQFQEGSYWGLDHFVNIQLLQTQHFIHPNKLYLQLQFHVKESSFYHANKNQDHVIRNKELVWKDNDCNVKGIKKKLQFKGVCIRKQCLRSMGVRALVDRQERSQYQYRSYSTDKKVIKKPQKQEI